MIREGADSLFRILFAGPAVFLTRVVFGLRFRGAHHIPRAGPALLVPNHQGYLDPFFVQMATVRPVRYLMTSDFYDVRLARPLFRLVGAIRVPEGGPYRAAMREAGGVIEAGGLVGIFPEGRLSRDGRMGQALPGAAFLAARTGAPVIPARIRGSIRVLPHGEWLPRQAEVEVRFGPPLHVARKERGAPERIFAAVAALG